MRKKKGFLEVRLAGRHRVTERSGVFGEMHVLSNCWNIKDEERSVEVRRGGVGERWFTARIDIIARGVQEEES